MKVSITTSFRLVVLAGISFVTPALAVVDIDYVPVGNAGNANDSTGYGSVAYAYKIAKNETTISQYAEFLNAAAQTDTYGLYNTSMDADGNVAGISRSGSSGSYTYSVLTGAGNRPIAYVSWFDAARFCNWLHNGQGSGSTETGAYTLAGAMSGVILKNGGAAAWIPSEDEWYKAAYYDPTPGAGGGDNYWLHATQSDTLTNNSLSANYYDGDYAVTQSGSYSSTQNYLTNVGAYGTASDSFYGTNDQGGSLFEWNDAVISGSSRGLRGGSWVGNESLLRASDRYDDDPEVEGFGVVGFRVASVPEPSGLVLTILASGMIFARRKR
jgi:formylglycine-generating enzyme